MKGKLKLLFIVISLQLIGVAAAFLLTGCGGGPEPAEDDDGCPSEDCSVIAIEQEGARIVYADTDTGVCYLSVTRGNGTALVMLVNPDGTPKTYEVE